ncbi:MULTISPECIES: ABC transporter permease DevC [unclassified Tolypothrix]|uniref:ABC transporter permease DevC n=1 Tax=unclassified Tolypothrix TaxID=2649714 RepID=UPI0005EABE4F|nr:MULTISPECIES: ABC transporter permease DevC [unclassified Tolypothrix]BAY95495.1 heterocyst specific ABC-transporter, membrane spanning subunit DevC [Microchaete diplosiphon NIES-3275]EKE97242.1 ABC exporter transmembrane subunit, DevC protein [Tolypothrix sp. PCC 7601]MBE9084892.1 FtsX-like permease family protein [Tolypothrix sp. LEGE 11397]UYD30601.1 FtsX-like permease family protein [Tolypothrix sp. PCC 7712]UYD38472.1 FtsX-like permease family protein [Tolypothrix sp. PCC 7601]
MKCAYPAKECSPEEIKAEILAQIKEFIAKAYSQVFQDYEKIMNEITLAWLQLTKNKFRLVGILSGISILVATVLTNLGLQDALYESNTRIHQNFKGELVLIHKKTNVLHESLPFSTTYLYRLEGLAEVTNISSLYLNFSRLQIPNITNETFVLVFGVNINNSPFKVENLNEKLDKAKIPNVVLIDRNSRPEYSILIKEYDSGIIPIIKLDGKKVRIEDVVQFNTASFVSDVSFITSSFNFIEIFPYLNPNNINIGVIQLKQNVNPKSFIKKLEDKKYLPVNLKLLTRQEFIDSEKQYWAIRSPIGFVFSLVVFMTVIVQVIVVYQIMSTEIASHLPEYALLKARGYTNSYFVIVILQESIFLAILAYLQGLIISLFIYELAKDATSLPITMDFRRAIIVLLLTMGVCLAASLIATNKLKEADPINLL